MMRVMGEAAEMRREAPRKLTKGRREAPLHKTQGKWGGDPPQGAPIEKIRNSAMMV